MATYMRGAPKVTHDAATAGSAVIHNCGGYNALLVHHLIDGATSGGYVSLKMSPTGEAGSFIAHHGGGQNIKSANTKDSYTCLFTGIMEHVEVTLTRTDGTHTVTIQPINL